MASVNQAIQYFAVTAKCGHSGQGRGYYVRIEFAVIAESGSEAAAKVRTYPRVKHHHKDAIQSVRSISEAEYDEIVSRNDSDPYLQARSIQEQRRLITDDEMTGRLIREDAFELLSRSDMEMDRWSRTADPSLNHSKMILFASKTRIRKPYRFYHYWPTESIRTATAQAEQMWQM